LPQIYHAADVAAARFDLAKRTKMSDYAIECHQLLHGEGAAVPPGASLRRAPPSHAERSSCAL